MASKGLQCFSRSIGALRASICNSKDPLTQCLVPQMSRSMATATTLTSEYTSASAQSILDSMTEPSESRFSPDVLTTIYEFSTMKPLRFETYPSTHLHLPLRRDILHRAIIYEGDNTRLGTASSKTRYQVHGSHQKMRAQKGSGKARVGTRQSPILRGGGKTFGPHPRDFGTDLPRKMYDLAWRTALSYRYRKGELVVCEDGMELEEPETGFLKEVWGWNGWGRDGGRSLVVTMDERENLWKAKEGAGEEGEVLTVEDVDVKDLLGMGRVIIEKSALDRIFQEHSKDLISKVRKAM